jgi:glycosyltransferase involved in cell wall biosynthesis
MISVLIPSFKPGEYFKECIKSLEGQTLSKDSFFVYIALNGPQVPYEYNINSVLERISFRYKYIYIKEPGVSSARNELIDSSDGDYVVFLDDDDVLSENYLENLLKVSTDKYMGISNIVNFERDINKPKENYIGKTFLNLNNYETSKFKTRKFFSSVMAKMIHRDMIEDIRFDTRLSKGEDSLFMTLISKNILGIKKTPGNTFYYVYERENSASRKKTHIHKEIKVAVYLMRTYILLLFNSNYNSLFLLTRIAAILKKILKKL